MWTSESKKYSHAAIAGQVICNGHFTTDEEDASVLDWYKKEYPWLFFDQAWTVTGKTNEDTDRATIANITGNGNNLVLSNFGFAGNSGYGLYPTIASKYEYTDAVYTRVFISFSNIKSISVKFVLTGLHEENGEKFFLRVRNSNASIYVETYTKDGTYVFTYEYTGEDPIQLVGYNSMSAGEEHPKGNFIVDIIPDHEGYLVTDGVDDRIESAKFNVNKDFTVVGEWELLDSVSTSSGIAEPNSFYLYSRTNGLGFYCKNASLGKFLNLKSIAAFNSNGIAYDHKWEEYINDYLGNDNGYYSTLFMGFGNNFFFQDSI